MAANTNVMSVAPQAGNGPRVAGGSGRQNMRPQSRMSSQKNGKFGEVLGQTQDQGKLSPKDVVDEAMDLPKDPIAAAIAASSQTKQNEQPAKEAQADAEDTAKIVPEAQQAEEPLETSMEGSASEDLAETLLKQFGGKEASTTNLQTLLPQSEGVGEKGRSMLHILSGQGWRTAKPQASEQVAMNPAMQEAEPMDVQKAQTMRMVQDVLGVSTQEMPQLISKEGLQPLSQAIQQERPQAQPGMQGMPMMQDAQAPLTHPTQNVPKPQIWNKPVQMMDVPAQVTEAPVQVKNVPIQVIEGQAQVTEMPFDSLEQPLRQSIGTGSNQQEQSLRQPMAKMVPTMQGQPMNGGQLQVDGKQSLQPMLENQPIIEEQPLTSEKQDLATPEGSQRAQAIPMTEDVVRQAPVAASAWTESQQAQQRTREDISKLLGTQVSMESREKQPIEALRQMMHGQEQQGEGRQQSEDRQPMPQRTEVRSASEEVVENRPSMQANVVQTPAETVSQPHPTMNFQQALSTAQASETTQAPMASSQDFDIPGQIVEQARLIRSSENTEMVIRLKPEHLGELTLKVSVSENGAVTASFHSDNAQVRAIIENSLVQLRQELSNQGIKVDNVEVYAGLSEDSLLSGQGQQAWQQGQQGNSSRNRNMDFDSYEEENAEFAQAVDGTITEEGVDYRV